MQFPGMKDILAALRFDHYFNMSSSCAHFSHNESNVRTTRVLSTHVMDVVR